MTENDRLTQEKYDQSVSEIAEKSVEISKKDGYDEPYAEAKWCLMDVPLFDEVVHKDFKDASDVICFSHSEPDPEWWQQSKHGLKNGVRYAAMTMMQKDVKDKIDVLKEEQDE